MIKKKRSLAGILFIILILVIIIIFNLLKKEKTYEIEYKIDGFTIIEKYDEKNNSYEFDTVSGDYEFSITILNPKKISKKQIDKVDSLKKDETTCIFMSSKNLKTYPICQNDKNKIAYSNSGLYDENFFKIENFKITKGEYKNIEINTLRNKKIAIWNNYGFTLLNENKNFDINFLKNELYFDTMSYRVDNYIIVPNYDSKYSFNEIFIIDLKKGKLKKWDLEIDINFDFYYQGALNGKIYLVDKKSKKQYSLDPKKRKIELITDSDGNGKIWNEKWITISMIKLVNNEYLFESESLYDYFLDKKTLYLKFKNNSKIKISNFNIDKIVYSDGYDVYYLAGDELYSYNPFNGEVLMLKYSEWNFNDKNPIYIF